MDSYTGLATGLNDRDRTRLRATVEMLLEDAHNALEELDERMWRILFAGLPENNR